MSMRVVLLATPRCTLITILRTCKLDLLIAGHGTCGVLQFRTYCSCLIVNITDYMPVTHHVRRVMRIDTEPFQLGFGLR